MKLFLILLALMYASEASAQKRPIPQRKVKKDSIVERNVVLPAVQQQDVRRLFGQIEDGILRSTLVSSPLAFANHVNVNITGGESGYFSSNQATSVLQTYFSGRMPLSFQFTNYSDKGPNPYATGRFTFARRGQRESAQIYVSLVRQEARWVIRQFNVY